MKYDKTAYLPKRPFEGQQMIDLYTLKVNGVNV